MRKNRNVSIGLIFGSEKGYVNRDTDAGGPTNWGITQRTLAAWRGHAVSIQDVKDLTQGEAYEIYASEYWGPIRGDDLPDGLDYCVMDSCVTSGANRASRILQEILVADGARIKVDGNIGRETLTAIENFTKGIEELIRDYCDARVAFMRTLKGKTGWPSNGRGWHIRVLGIDPTGKWAPQPGVVGNALKMHMTAIPQSPHVQVPVPTVTQVPETGGAKAKDSDVGLGTILKKPEAVATWVTTATGVLTAVTANSILSYALAAVMVIGAGCAGFYFIHRVRSGTLS